MSIAYLCLQSRKVKEVESFFTPSCVVRTLVEVLQPFVGECMIRVVAVAACLFSLQNL